MNTRQSAIAIILILTTLGLADGNPTSSQLKAALILLVITICYTITMTLKNKSTHGSKHDNDATRYGGD